MSDVSGPPFRAGHVGSLLRLLELPRARAGSTLMSRHLPARHR